MVIRSVFDPEFAPYGKVVTGLEQEANTLLETLRAISPKPEDGTIYEPSDARLESLPAAQVLCRQVYGGMPIQLGYCNGSNTRLNCLEYHRDSEINIPADDMIFLVARQQEAVEGKLDTSLVQAFATPAGTVVELYATTLHYAPCNAKAGEGFRVLVVLPRGTNTEKPAVEPKNWEDRLLWACNKWLLAHPDSNEAAQGAFVGLSGENIDLKDQL